MKYKLNQKIFYTNIILCIILVSTIIYVEGINVVRTRTETITCPQESTNPCEFITGQGEHITLKIGEEKTLNQFNQQRLNLANYGVWTLIIISVIINHITQNNKYPIKKELHKLYNKIKRIRIN